ncbi:hypothetical protein HK105_200456 [Polyrhizophydium stewartii]|uniref:Protein kinase domain-containing protein n=1 Tax=Polyrhizophydium stewartii TaxID=2732419 RepID=A0ABR4NLH4_9FUNG
MLAAAAADDAGPARAAHPALGAARLAHDIASVASSVQANRVAAEALARRAEAVAAAAQTQLSVPLAAAALADLAKLEGTFKRLKHVLVRAAGKSRLQQTLLAGTTAVHIRGLDIRVAQLQKWLGLAVQLPADVVAKAIEHDMANLPALVKQLGPVKMDEQQLQAKLAAELEQGQPLLDLPESLHPWAESLIGNVKQLCVACLAATPKEQPKEQAMTVDVDIFWDRLIGESGHAQIYRGEWGGRAVAVRVISKPLGRAEVEDIEKQAALWLTLRHPNLHQLWRICANVDKPLVITPLMRCNAAEFLHKAPQTPVEVRTHILLCAARGLQYLHEQQPLIVHGDFKASSVLISNDGDVCVSDFVPILAQTSPSSSGRQSGGAGVARWIAPERYKRGYKLAPPSDMFLFGMAAFNITSGSVPFADEPHDGIVAGWIKDGERPDRPKRVPDALWRIIERCWQADPAGRLSVGEVVATLKALPHTKPSFGSAKSDVVTCPSVKKANASCMTDKAPTPSRSNAATSCSVNLRHFGTMTDRPHAPPSANVSTSCFVTNRTLGTMTDQLNAPRRVDAAMSCAVRMCDAGTMTVKMVGPKARPTPQLKVHINSQPVGASAHSIGAAPASNMQPSAGQPEPGASQPAAVEQSVAADPDACALGQPAARPRLALPPKPAMSKRKSAAQPVTEARQMPTRRLQQPVSGKPKSAVEPRVAVAPQKVVQPQELVVKSQEQVVEQQPEIQQPETAQPEPAAQPPQAETHPKAGAPPPIPATSQFSFELKLPEQTKPLAQNQNQQKPSAPPQSSNGATPPPPPASDADRLVMTFTAWCRLNWITPKNARTFAGTVQLSGMNWKVLEWSGEHLHTLLMHTQGIEGPLSKYIAGFSHLKYLRLTNNSITELPEEFGELSELVELDVTYNQLEAIPESIGNLTKLQYFWINNNKVKQLPDSICRLTKLEWLWLDSNQIPKLPDAIGSLVELKKLNCVTLVPRSLGDLANLQYLGLQSNHLASFPECIYSLKGLIGLSLDGNQIKTVPPAISSLTQLRRLELDNNLLSSLPASIGNMKELTKMWVTYRASFNAGFSALLTHGLSRSLESNQLETLPESIGGLAKLEELRLSNNKLAALPASVGRLKKLTQLNLANNQLKALPITLSEIPCLTQL